MDPSAVAWKIRFHDKVVPQTVDTSKLDPPLTVRSLAVIRMKENKVPIFD